MTTQKGLLTDARLRQALIELAAGTDAATLTRDVLRAIDATPQARRAFAPPSLDRRLVPLWIAVLLGVALLGAAIVGGGFSLPPGPPTAAPSRTPVRTFSPVVQSWNGLRDSASLVTHTVFGPGSREGVPLAIELPANAVGLRWSPDGRHLAYFEQSAPSTLVGFKLVGLFVAAADGTAARAVELPRAISTYSSNGFWAGVAWAPTGSRFALQWSTRSCSGPDCIPPGGIDVFDAEGALVASIPTPGDDPGVIWSADGRAIGWTTSSCPNSCTTQTFSWRLVDGDPTVTNLATVGAWQIAWTDRSVFVVQGNANSVNLVYTMAPDGSDIRDVLWPDVVGARAAVVSPDGRSIAALDAASGTLRIRDVGTGSVVQISVPGADDLATWAPDGSRLVLVGEDRANPQRYAFSVVDVDGANLALLGGGDDYGWLPGSVAR